MTQLKFVDVTGQTVWVNRQTVAVTIPSPIASPNSDGQCRVIVPGGLISIVTRTEAERVVEELTKE